MKKILIVDDNYDILELIKLILDMEGYDTFGITDADDLFKIINKFEPDLILMDIMLGKLDGRDLCNTIKSTSTTSQIPVVMISASHDLRSLVQRDCKAEGFISKPFDVSFLVNKVGSLVA